MDELDHGPAPGRWVRWGFVVVSLVDTIVTIALSADEQRRIDVLIAQLAFSVGHVLSCGFVLGAMADLGHLVLPRRALVHAVATWLAGIALGFGIFLDDFAVFLPWIRGSLVALSALPFALLVASSSLMTRRRALVVASLVGSLALTIANSFVLDRTYAGIHLTVTLAAGLLAGVGLMGLLRDRSRVPLVPARAAAAGWAFTALAAAASIALWPSNDVLLALARQPTASLVPFLARLRELRSEGASPSLPPGQEPWFVDRSTFAPIAPTTPALHPRPIVILLTVDALRADVVADDSQVATRNLRAIAARGAFFSQARSPASATSPSIAALFTGKYYSSLHWTPQPEGSGKLKYFLPEEPALRWPELLGDHGVRRVMVRRRGSFGPESGLIRGMDEYTRPFTWADEIVDHIVGILDDVGDEPLFIYSHLMDPHAPYTSRGTFARARDGYLAEVEFVDEQLERLRASISRRRLTDRTFLIVSADHGEAFGEHGASHHATSIYEELVRIPLVITGPGVAPRVIDEPVSLVDLGPTVLDLFGADTPGYFMGQSLVPLLRGDHVELTRPIILDTGRRKQALVGRDRLKIIRNLREGTTELYDLDADPGERDNLFETRPREGRERLGALASFFELHELRREGYVIPFRD